MKNDHLMMLGAAALVGYLYATNNGPTPGVTWWDSWFNPASVPSVPLSHARQGISGLVPVTLSNVNTFFPRPHGGVRGEGVGVGYIVDTPAIDSIPSMSFGGAFRQPSQLSY